MTGEKRFTTVAGKTYTYWADYGMRCTYAEDEEGNVKILRGGCYMHNDLTVRKTIALVFGLPTFRK